MSGKVISEKDFKLHSCVPEWGIRYPSGVLLLFEYCTEDNFYRQLKWKVRKYQDYVLNSKERVVVLFVLDVSREKVKKFIERHQPVGPFYFVDYETFLKVPLGNQLTAPIYFWGEDQNVYALRKP